MRRITIDFMVDEKAGKAGRFLVFIHAEKDPKADRHENAVCDMVLPEVRKLVLGLMPTPTGVGNGSTMEEARVRADLEADITEAGGKEEENGKP